ncbi:MAG: hypothetical protein JNJ77_19475 [Planctomycetia bacterium]|nr:hypothetical protein [Planctomycetia bacterium]
MTSLTRAMMALGLVGTLLGGSVGCQTWVGGMTLPSPDYLKDKPDYIQPAPLYKHSKELASMQKSMAEANPDMYRYPVRNVQPVVTPPLPANPGMMPNVPVAPPLNPPQQ